ncbi:Uncharacterized protein APZ42_023340 [Daphnia magna]|uniref:Uncharacterized protein n=1 Tax=Daphnia magna TaxID=35525 RepID=A0A164V198_9CRUS|nr:Uncharacterized protein APZ42_023340 [Daphnia magna]
MENTLTELNNRLRRNRDARVSSAGLSCNDKPFFGRDYQRQILKRERETEPIILCDNLFLRLGETFAI